MPRHQTTTYSPGMNKSYWATLAAVALFAPAVHAADSGRIPMNPLPPIALYGHTNVLLLQNRIVEAAIFPTLGRVGVLNFRGDQNLLRFDTGLAEASTAALTEAPADWRNFGGDWVWPVSQARWPAHFGANWPPPWLLDGPAWTANGWINNDQSQSVLMKLEIGDPVNIIVYRNITLPADSSTLTIRQRIERTAPSEIPVTLWNISQLAGVQRVALATETNSAFNNGYRVLDFSPPPPEMLNAEISEALVVNVGNIDEVKIGADSPRGWIAAQRGDTVIIESAKGRADAADFPDHGCRAELYSNSGLGYSEIETLSEEIVLAAGESVENTLTISLYRVPAELDDAAFATRIRELLGEQAPVAEPVPE